MYELKQSGSTLIFTEVKDTVDKNLYTYPQGIQSLCEHEFFQYLGQNKAIIEIAEEIRDKKFTCSQDSKFIKLALTGTIPTTLCNVNMRILVTNNYLARKGENVFSFKEAYKILLSKGGVNAGSYDNGNPDSYKILLGYQPKIAKTEKDFLSFIQSRPKQLIRVWSQNGSAYHATGLWYEDKIYCLDTAALDRNMKVWAPSSTIHGKTILHMETLDI